MRSRYSAYAMGNAAYIIATTHPDHPDSQISLPQRRKEIKKFCRQTQFQNLEILDEAETSVTFKATLLLDNQDVSFTEKSAFAKLNDQWFYLGTLQNSG
jgi:SEC-C motif domain protein